jgi:hypothetical protein
MFFVEHAFLGWSGMPFELHYQEWFYGSWYIQRKKDGLQKYI